MHELEIRGCSAGDFRYEGMLMIPMCCELGSLSGETQRSLKCASDLCGN